MIKVTVSVRNDNPNKLAARLGREPTHAEAKAEVQRILDEALVDAASAGKLRWQR